MAKQQKLYGGLLMAIGKRIKLFRNRKNLTQKQLGEQLGFLGRTSDVRMAQYESVESIPKQNLMKQMSGILGVSPDRKIVL